MKSIRPAALSLASLAVLLATSLTLAQVAAPPAPTTKPAKLQPTPEQKKLSDQNWQQATDVPAVKIDLNPGVEGSPNANFGQPERGFIRRHESFLERAKEPVGLLFLGDSITQGWEGGGKDVWKNAYEKYDAANFGIGGDRTQHVLWRIANGELDSISPNPKVVVIMIGTNNIGQSAEQITAGTTAVVHAVQAKLPQSKILLLSIFPRDAKPDSPRRQKLQQVNAELAKLADGAKLRYLEIWKQFLTEDGTLTKEIMPDALHPNAAGYKIWAETMQPVLDEMMK